MNKRTEIGNIRPVISINRHGYQRQTIQAKASLYPLNTKIDKASHDHLRTIREYYDRLTGLNVRASVIMRRAIAVLAEHLETADLQTEQNAIFKASQMEDR